jgi:lipoprotein NlpI
MRVALLPVLLFALVIQPLAAAEKILTDGFEATIDAVPDWVERGPVPAPPSAEGDAPTETLRQDVQIDVASQSMYVEMALMPRSRNAAEEIGRVQVEFDPHYQRLILHEAIAHRGGEKVNLLSRDRLRMFARETRVEQRIYDGEVTAMLELAGIRPLDIVVLAYTVQGFNPAFEGKLAWMAPLAPKNFADETRIRLRTPLDRNVAALVRDAELASVETVRDGVRVTDWRQIKKAAPSDNADEEKEPTVGWIQLSEFASWAEVAQWGQRLFASSATAAPELDAMVEQVRGRGDKAAVESIFNFVSEDIRYLSTNFGASSHRPHEPATVLRQRFGDCKDKSLLLATALARLGISAQYVLVTGRGRKDLSRWLPSPLLFDHVIVYATVGGKAYWLDGTRTGQATDLDAVVPFAFGDVLVLDAATSAPSSIELEATQWRQTGRTKVTVTHPNAPVRIETEARYEAYAAEYLRFVIDARGKKQFAEDRAKWSLGRDANVTYPAPLMIDDDRTANVLTLRETLEVTKLFKGEGDGWITNLVSADMATLAYVGAQIDHAQFQVPPLIAEGKHETEVDVGSNEIQAASPERTAVANGRSEGRAALGKDASRLVVRAEINLGGFRGVAADDKHTPELAPFDDGDLYRVSLTLRDPPKDATGMGRMAVYRANAERLSQRIASGLAKGKQLANMFVQRGFERRYSLDLDGADQDFREALALDTNRDDLRAARGMVEILRDNFAAAAEHLAQRSSGDDRRGDYERAVALFCLGRFDDAAAEAERAMRNPSFGARPYLSMLAFIARGRAGNIDATRLGNQIDALEFLGIWPLPIARMLAGDVEPNAALEFARHDDVETQAVRTTELNFYIAQRHLLDGNIELARQALVTVINRGEVDQYEYAMAKAELARMSSR